MLQVRPNDFKLATPLRRMAPTFVTYRWLTFFEDLPRN